MKTRVLSAIFLIAIFIPFLVVGGKAFSVFMSILSVFSLYELIHIREAKKEIPLFLKLFAYLFVILISMNHLSTGSYFLHFRILSLILLLFLAPMVFYYHHNQYNLNDAFFCIGSILFIGISFNLLTLIRNFSIVYLIYLLLITTITDTFALFTGMLVGQHKLIPEVSPKKTVEGLIGGTFMGVFVATCFYITVINPSISLVLLIFVTLFLSLIGQLGDLVFSSIKRYYQKKDFSRLIPGHGGILDRLDSLIFVVLAFILVFGII